MNVGIRIKARRQELKMSVDELAKRLHKNRATIYRYEKGDIENLPIDILEPLAEALDTTPEYLMGWGTSATIEGPVVETLRTEQRFKEFKPGFFTDDEYNKLFEYARFLISQREKQ